MPLGYTTHARDRMGERGISETEVEAAIATDKNPWEEVINSGNHLRYFNNDVTVITNLKSDLVVTAWRGARGGW